jgi:hypothetical protein
LINGTRGADFLFPRYSSAIWREVHMRQTTAILLAVIIALFSISILPGNVGADTIIVPDDYSTIQEAINNANIGDIILVRAGTYYEDVTITKGLTLTGYTGAKIMGGIWIKNIHLFSQAITVENLIIEGGTSIDSTHDFGIKISGDVGFSDVNVVDMHIINNTLINCGKTDNVLLDFWWNGAIFYDSGHYGDIHNRYESIFTGEGEISHNTIINDLADPGQRTRLGIGVRSGLNLKINHNSIIGNVAEGIHHWGPTDIDSTGNYEICNNQIDLSGWIGSTASIYPRGILSYAPQTDIICNTITTPLYGMVLSYKDDTSQGGGTAGPGYGLTVSHNLIRPPPGGNMLCGMRMSGSNSEITHNEIYGARQYGMLFEGLGIPAAGENTECSHNLFEFNHIHDNLNGIYTWSTPYDNTFDNVFHENTIEGNSKYGFFNGHAGEVIDATDNYWGHPSGPYHSSSWIYKGNLITNPDGLGDEVTDYIIYQPWKLGQHTVTMDVTPESLNLQSKGNFINLKITELPETYMMSDIDGNSVVMFILGIPVHSYDVTGQSFSGKFDRADFEDQTSPGDVEVLVTGRFMDGSWFYGVDVISAH